MWILILILLLLGARLNLSGIVPLQIGDSPAPWWVGGRLLWPFAVETRTLLHGNALNTFTPLLSITSAILFLLAAAALLHWLVPGQWFAWLIVAGAFHRAAGCMVFYVGDSSTHRGYRTPVGRIWSAHHRSRSPRIGQLEEMGVPLRDSEFHSSEIGAIR
jgi:hypothetical protein